MITVSTLVAAPLEAVWRAYTTPADICVWNTASPDWHTPRAEVDLRPGGAFSSRMEAKDGSMGFDFAGEYTAVEPMQRIAYTFGGRQGEVTFTPGPQGVAVQVNAFNFPVWGMLEKFAPAFIGGMPSLVKPGNFEAEV